MTTTTILGANGKLGVILASHARRASLEWRTQMRSGVADVIWSGAFDDPAVGDVFQPGGTIINMIGATGGDPTTMADINERFVTRLLQTARKAGVAHVVLMSSAAVYGVGGNAPSREDDPVQPLTPYGETKCNMERIAQRDQTEMAITILRIGNVAGADALTTAARRHVAKRQPMPLHRFADGATATRSYIGPRDLFDAVHALAAPHHGPPRIVNVTHPQIVTLEDMLIAYKANVMPDLEWIDAPAPQGTPQTVTLSADKLLQYIEFEKYDDPADAFAAQITEGSAL